MTGFGCLLDGFSLLGRPGLRRYVVMPTIINALVLIVLSAIAYIQFDDWVNLVTGWLPAWLPQFDSLIRGVMLIVVLLALFVVFILMANIIASPFNAVLSIKVEALLTLPGTTTVTPDEQPGNLALRVMPRAIGRELSKLGYVLPRLLLLFIITIIPVVNTISPLLWLLFGAWMVTIQYADYGADNNGLSFRELRERLGRKRFHALAFGLPASLLLAIPLVNIILMPAAVAGGTRFWVEHLR